MNKQEIEQKISERASQDPLYKQELFNNPKSILAKEGINIPDDIEITVFQETLTSLALVLPVNSNTQELTEADLQAVSGGRVGLDLGWD